MRLIEEVNRTFLIRALETASVDHEPIYTEIRAPLVVSCEIAMSDALGARLISARPEDCPMLFRIGSEPIPGHERVGARTRSQLTGTAAILVLFIALIGCQDKQAASSAHTAATAPAVSIIVAEPKAVTLVKELPGRITPMRIAEVRPRVSGIIVKQTFEQGSLVKEGTVLYHIDPKPFEVELDAAKAALARSRRDTVPGKSSGGSPAAAPQRADHNPGAVRSSTGGRKAGRSGRRSSEGRRPACPAQP